MNYNISIQNSKTSINQGFSAYIGTKSLLYHAFHDLSIVSP